MFLWLKKLSGSVADGRWFSGRPDVLPLDLDRDWPGIEEVLAHDRLPHDRSDLEGWLAEPGSVGLVARKDDRFAGFMVAHPVGKVAHVDTVGIHPDFRRASIARPLYFRGVNALKVHGCTGFVAHARTEPGTLLQLLGYAAGDRFRLVSHDAGEFTVAGGHRGELVDEEDIDLDALADLDARVFGARRAEWLAKLLEREDTEIHGYLKKDALIAALVLQRKGDTLLIRLALGNEFKDISNLLHVVMVMNSGRGFHCWVRGGTRLEQMLDSLDFEDVPDNPAFTEFRHGTTAGVGDGDGVLHLAWW